MNARLLEEQGIEGPKSDHNEETDSKLFLFFVLDVIFYFLINLRG